MALNVQVAKEYMSTMGTPAVRARLQGGAHPPSISGAQQTTQHVSCYPDPKVLLGHAYHFYRGGTPQGIHLGV